MRFKRNAYICTQIEKNMSTISVQPNDLILHVEDASILPNLKKILKAIRGVSVVSVKSNDKIETRMTEEQFYKKIDHSLASGMSSWTMTPNESAEDFLTRVLG